MTSLVALTVLFAQTNQSPGFNSWQETLAGKQSVSATVAVNEVGGGSSTYTISMKKPASLRLETNDEIIVADGSTLTTYSKKDGIFYKQPQSDELLRNALHDDQFALFNGFFGKTLKPVKTEDAGTKTLGGEQVKAIKAMFDKSGLKVQQFFVSGDGIARRAQLSTSSKGKKAREFVYNAKNVVIDGQNMDALFAFKAPNGSKEMSYEDFVGSRWIYDFEEAKIIAAKTGKGIFVDFMAEWCGPCKAMAAAAFDTPEFKEFGKKVVFCKVDIDLNPALAEQYGVEAIPNVFVLKADGSVVGSILGWGGLDAFLSEMTDLTNKL